MDSIHVTQQRIQCCSELPNSIRNTKLMSLWRRMLPRRVPYFILVRSGPVQTLLSMKFKYSTGTAWPTKLSVASCLLYRAEFNLPSFGSIDYQKFLTVNHNELWKMILEGSTQPTAAALRSSYWKCMWIVWYVPPLVCACVRTLYIITWRFTSEYIEVPTAKNVEEIIILFFFF